jgi:hypothetical protein
MYDAEGWPVSHDAGHYFSGARHALFFNEDNVHTQCRSCNWLHEGNPLPYTIYMRSRYTANRLSDMSSEWLRAGKKYKQFEVDELAKVYKAQAEVLRKERER